MEDGWPFCHSHRLCSEFRQQGRNPPFYPLTETLPIVTNVVETMYRNFTRHTIAFSLDRDFMTVRLEGRSVRLLRLNVDWQNITLHITSNNLKTWSLTHIRHARNTEPGSRKKQYLPSIQILVTEGVECESWNEVPKENSEVKHNNRQFPVSSLQ